MRKIINKTDKHYNTVTVVVAFPEGTCLTNSSPKDTNIYDFLKVTREK